MDTEEQVTFSIRGLGNHFWREPVGRVEEKQRVIRVNNGKATCKSEATASLIESGGVLGID